MIFEPKFWAVVALYTFLDMHVIGRLKGENMKAVDYNIFRSDTGLAVGRLQDRFFFLLSIPCCACLSASFLFSPLMTICCYICAQVCCGSCALSQICVLSVLKLHFLFYSFGKVGDTSTSSVHKLWVKLTLGAYSTLMPD